jgi:glutamine synthetase
MSTIRFKLREASTRKPIKFEETGRKSVLFGSNVFNDKAMKQYLTSDLKESKVQYSMELK